MSFRPIRGVITNWSGTHETETMLYQPETQEELEARTRPSGSLLFAGNSAFHVLTCLWLNCTAGPDRGGAQVRQQGPGRWVRPVPQRSRVPATGHG